MLFLKSCIFGECVVRSGIIYQQVQCKDFWPGILILNQMKSDEILICCKICQTLQCIKISSTFMWWFDIYNRSKQPLYRAWGLILHNIDCVPFPGVVRGRRQAEEEEGEVRTLIKVSTEVRDVIVCVCVCVVCVCAIGSSTEYSIP